MISAQMGGVWDTVKSVASQAHKVAEATAQYYPPAAAAHQARLQMQGKAPKPGMQPQQMMPMPQMQPMQMRVDEDGMSVGPVKDNNILMIGGAAAAALLMLMLLRK